MGEVLYVLVMSTGVSKIGRTRNPKRRTRAHARTAKVFGATIQKSWISDPMPCAKRAELELRRMHTRHSLAGEWLHGVDAETLIRDAKICADRHRARVTLEQPTASPVGTVWRQRSAWRRLMRIPELGGSERHVAIQIWISLWSMVPELDGKTVPMIEFDYQTLSIYCPVDHERLRRGLVMLEEIGQIELTRNRGSFSVRLTPPGFRENSIAALHRPFSLPPMEAARRRLSSMRPSGRVGATMTVAMAGYACAHADWAIQTSSDVQATIAVIRDVANSGQQGTSFYRRMRWLQDAGLVSRRGRAWRDGIIMWHPNSGRLTCRDETSFGCDISENAITCS